MRVGIYLDLRNPPDWHRDPTQLYGRALERIEEAERLGAGSVWVSEHHGFDDGYMGQPIQGLVVDFRGLRVSTNILNATNIVVDGPQGHLTAAPGRDQLRPGAGDLRTCQACAATRRCRVSVSGFSNAR